MLMTVLLSRMPDLRHRVETEHIPDRAGHCQECGRQIAWPCELSRIAVAAQRLNAA
jgi:hypothetical protein